MKKIRNDNIGNVHDNTEMDYVNKLFQELTKKMEIKKENVVNAYMAGDNIVKEMLRNMFPDIDFEADNVAENRPITERVKTFEDACRELGGEHQFVVAYDRYMVNVHDDSMQDTDIIAYLKLRIICTALNEGWEPQFTQDEWRLYPWFFLWTSEELEKEDEEWKPNRHLMSTDDFHTEYAGFAFAFSCHEPSNCAARIGSCICLKNEALAEYCGKQFIELWADFNLIRRR